MATTATIIRTELAETARLHFLPALVGDRFMIRFESLVYRFAREFCDAYKGGFWDYYTLDNGGGYMALRSDDRIRAASPNGSTFNLSADAFGITCTLFALSELSFFVDAKGTPQESDKVSDRFHALREFAQAHEEASAIFSLID
jgi:hypothetical protein